MMTNSSFITKLWDWKSGRFWTVSLSWRRVCSFRFKVLRTIQLATDRILHMSIAANLPNFLHGALGCSTTCQARTCHVKHGCKGKGYDLLHGWWWQIRMWERFCALIFWFLLNSTVLQQTNHNPHHIGSACPHNVVHVLVFPENETHVDSKVFVLCYPSFGVLKALRIGLWKC